MRPLPPVLGLFYPCTVSFDTDEELGETFASVPGLFYPCTVSFDMDEELGETFAPLFESQRQSNKILHSWVQCRKNPPQRLLDLLDMKPSAVPGARADQTKGGSYRPRSPRSKVVPNPPKLKRSMPTGP